MGLLPYLNDPPVFLLAFLLGAFGLILHNLFQAWLADRYGEVAPRPWRKEAFPKAPQAQTPCAYRTSEAKPNGFGLSPP